MKKTLLFAALLGASAISQAQIIDFESPVLDSDTSWFGQDQIIYGDTSYAISSASFHLSCDTVSWGTGYSWTGSAISSMTDLMTPGIGNQFSSITGSGADGSNQYAVSYYYDNDVIFDSEDSVYSMEVTNTYFAHNEIRDGGMFSRAFGDTVGGNSGEDWFILTVYGLDADTNLTGDSVNFYLADYRFANDNDDYIVDTWKTVDLYKLGAVHGIRFNLTSSDTGQWGMNTPNYFAYDNLSFENGTQSISENALTNISVYPNPTNGMINYVIDQNEINDVRVINQFGQVVLTETPNSSTNQINLSDFGKGIYFIEFTGATSSVMRKVLVH